MIGNLRGFIRNEIISFEKELKEKAIERFNDLDLMKYTGLEIIK